MLPDAVKLCQPWLVALSIFGVIYGSLLAWRQTDFKAQIAYGSISHMGWVLLGLALLNPLSISGAWMQVVGHGLVTAPLFLLAGSLYEKKHTREISSYAGLALESPRMATIVSMALLMSLGLPSTLGFIAEFKILMGAYPSMAFWIVLPALAMLVAAVYVFRTIGIFFEYRRSDVNGPLFALQDLSYAEMTGVLIILCSSIVLGMYPDLLQHYLRASISVYLANFPAN